MRYGWSAVLFAVCSCAAWAQTTAPASEPAIRADELMPTIPWNQAGEFIGKDVFAVGKVVRASKARTGHAFLNFETDRNAKGLVIFINKDFYDKFPNPPDKFYRDKIIKVRGGVTEFKGAPEIIVSTPDQIEVLPEGTELPKPASRPAGAAAAPSVGDTITIGSYNVLNMFDSYDDPYTHDEGTPAKPRAQFEALAKSIRGLGADVLALTEVENRGILQQFVTVFLSDMGYEVVLFEGNDQRGIDVALLSRLPIGNVTSHRHLRFPDAQGKMIHYQRDLLEVGIEPPGHRPFEVFVAHFKSKGGEENGGLDVREGEAKETRKIFDGVLKAKPDAPFVLCGDFNDTIDSDPLKTVIGEGPMALTTFVKELPPGENISYNLPPFLSMIDFILASPQMAKDYVSHSYRIVGGGSPEKTGSDHNPVKARFRLEPPSNPGP